MKSERILWKVLCHPEPVDRDERMEQLEWKGYYLGYWIFMLLIYLNVILVRGWGQLWMDKGSMLLFFSQFFSLCVVFLVEGSRFLYSCYHGIQEFADRSLIGRHVKSSGKIMFLSTGIFQGVWGFLASGFYFGWKHPAAWLIFAGGTVFYWLLCHLAYLHYALQADCEELLHGIVKGISTICGVGYALYMVVLLVFGLFSADRYVKNGGISQTETVLLTQEEQNFWEEIERGEDRFYELDSKEVEYVYHTDLREGPDVYDFPYGPLAARTRYLTSGGISYEQLLGASDPSPVFWESYWDEENTYVAVDGQWMLEQEYIAREQPEEGTMWNDFHGGPFTELSQVEGITREFQGQNTFYTVRYRKDSDISFYGTETEDGRRPEMVTEHYTLNEFDILTAYDCEIQGVRGDGQPYTERSAFALINAGREEIEKEVQALLEQYPKKEKTFF